MPSETIIKTKLRLPFTRPNLVPRPCLKHQIDQGLQGLLTLITAPAGFGKTTLTASQIRESGLPAAWLSLDKDDNLSRRFLHYLAAALHAVDKRVANEVLQWMASPQQPPAQAVLTSLINDLDQTNRELVLVLDDYHEIHNPDIHEHISFLLNHCPQTLHMLILSRSDPPLPLARLRARGQMAELRAADLRFNAEETAQFLNEIMGFDLDQPSITALETRTEGWITGLHMAALSMRERKDRHNFIENFSGTNRFILDYLMEDVLNQQPPQIQTFLLITSLLKRMSAPLCDFLLSEEKPGKEAAAALAYLEQSNLFVQPLDDERCWYRYHHLFSDLLRARLLKTQPETIPQLHQRASIWLEKNGYYHEAIDHLLTAKMTSQATDLIERYGPLCFQEDDPSVLQMADSLPQECLLTHPKLGLHLAWLLIIQGQIKKTMQLLRGLSRSLDENQPNSDQHWQRTVITLALTFLTPQQSADTIPFPAYNQVQAIPENEPVLRNAADFLFVMTLARRGELDRSVEVTENCLQRQKTHQNLTLTPSLLFYLSRAYLMQGRLHAAANLCREILTSTNQDDPQLIDTMGNIRIDLGEVLCEWNRLEEAETLIRKGLQSNQVWQNIMTDGFGLVALTRVLLARGNFSEALKTAETLEQRLETPRRPHEFEEAFRTLKIRVQLAAGNRKNPAQWADQILQAEDFEQQIELYRYTLALIRLEQGRVAEVESLLRGAAFPDSVGSRITQALEIHLLLAVAAARQGHTKEAFIQLESALTTAQAEGYVRVFLDRGEALRDLLTAYLRSANQPSTFARKILEAFSQLDPGSNTIPQMNVLIEPLSDRELEILTIMAQGKTNKEIAEILVIAPGTVKAHAASIYRKLETNNRTEAVNRARELDLLP